MPSAIHAAMSYPLNLLVTGGAGFIGSTYVEQRAAAGDRVVVLDALTYAGHPENLSHIKERWELVTGNICDTPLVINLLKKHDIDAMVCFAAESHVDNSIEKPAAFIETNINGTYSLLEASRAWWNAMNPEKRKRYRHLQVSTDEVYGTLGDTGKFNEESPIRPNSPYSASKAAGDHLTRAWHETYGLPALITNCTNNYGPRQHPEKLIPRIITCALAGEKLPVYGQGKNIRDWIHVEDHCRGVHLALTRGRAGDVYCFGGNAEKRNIEVVHTICDILDRLKPRAGGGSYREQIAFVKDRPGHDWRYAMDDSKARKELGFKRRHNFQSGLEATVKWYLENTQWCQRVTRKAA